MVAVAEEVQTEEYIAFKNISTTYLVKTLNLKRVRKSDLL